MKKNLEYYLDLPWTYRFYWSDIDNCYMASIEELEGCETHADTLEKAIEMIRDALKTYIYSCLKYNDNIPEPLKISNYKGNITYRTTPEKHYKLAQKAASLGKSINKLIDEIIDNNITQAQ